jgi:5'(3')-deoxyribonucleotidase
MNARVCVDIDNVIAMTDNVMRKVIQEITHGRVNLTYEQVIDFKYQRCIDSSGQKISDQEWMLIHDRFSDADHLSSVQIREGAIESLQRIAERYSIHIVTSRLPKARVATVQWLEKYFIGMAYGLHFVSHGEKHIVIGDLCASVEDDFKQAADFATREVKSFLIDHPWNRSGAMAKNLIRCRGWTDVAHHLLETY